MAGLVTHADFNGFVVNICHDSTSGDIEVIGDLPIQLPVRPIKKKILRRPERSLRLRLRVPGIVGLPNPADTIQYINTTIIVRSSRQYNK